MISDNAVLYSFDPPAKQFTSIANLGSICPTTSTFSMSVDRNGLAWIMMQNGKLYTVDINNPTSCNDSGWVTNQNGWTYTLFGLGFASNSAVDQCDYLYTHSWNGQGGFTEGPGSGKLGRIDTTMAPPPVQVQGTINYNGGELTGLSDGRLFAFAGTNPAKLVEYNKADATVVATTPLNGLNLGNAFAFAHYDGDFYFFTATAGNSKVSKLDYTGDQSLDNNYANAPIRIVGAGVSTCAPIPQ